MQTVDFSIKTVLGGDLFLFTRGMITAASNYLSVYIRYIWKCQDCIRIDLK